MRLTILLLVCVAALAELMTSVPVWAEEPVTPVSPYAIPSTAASIYPVLPADVVNFIEYGATNKAPEYPVWASAFREWNRVNAIPDLHPDLRDTKVGCVIRQYNQLKRNLQELALVNGKGKTVGVITVTADWTDLVAFHLRGSYQEEADGVAPILYTQAIDVAVAFCKQMLPVEQGELVIDHVKPSTTSRTLVNGAYEVQIAYCQEDVAITMVELYVDYAGRVFSVETFSAIDNLGLHLENLPQSPGPTAALAHIVQSLKAQGMNYKRCIFLDRIIMEMSSRGVPTMAWEALLEVEEQGESMAIYLWAPEGSDTYKVLRKEPYHDPEPATSPSRSPSYELHPIWQADGKELWWQTNAHWNRLPDWWTESVPSSLCNWTQDTQQAIVYRPLVDYPRLRTNYTMPAPSPDGRWLVASSDRVILIDLKRNRLYSCPGDFRVTTRPSWSSDGSLLACVCMGQNARAHTLNIITVRDTDGAVVFEQAQGAVKLPADCQAMEFLPDSEKDLIGVIGEGRVVHVTLPDHYLPAVLPQIRIDSNAVPVLDGYIIEPATVTDIVTLPATPHRVHLTPDGQHLLFTDDKGLHDLDLATKAITDIPWLAEGKEVALGATVQMVSRLSFTDYTDTGLDWDLTADGKRIAFNATNNDDHSVCILTANIDGSNMQRASSSDPTAKRNRYCTNDGMPVVPIESLSIATLLEFGYAPDTSWPIPVVANALP
jgi:hypothetical protein